MKVAISISNPGEEELARQGMALVHLQDAMVETARFLLNAGHTLVYGGDLSFDGGFNFTDLLFQISRAHGGKDRVVNYAAFPLYTKITVQREAELLPVAEIIRVNPSSEFNKWEYVRYESAIDDQRAYLNEIFDNMSPEARKIWAESLTAMRVRMTEDLDCRIVLGGKMGGFKGAYPGIWEETVLCVEQGKVVFVDGRFGGAAGEIVTALKQRRVVNDHGLGDRAHRLANSVYEEFASDRIVIGPAQPWGDIINLLSLI